MSGAYPSVRCRLAYIPSFTNLPARNSALASSRLKHGNLKFPDAFILCVNCGAARKFMVDEPERRRKLERQQKEAAEKEEWRKKGETKRIVKQARRAALATSMR